MASTDALKKYLDAGMTFTSLTRARAEQVVKDLVKAGDLQRSQAKEAIEDLLERSKRNTEILADQVRKEVDSQLADLGVARKADLERLEAKLSELKNAGRKAMGRARGKAEEKTDTTGDVAEDEASDAAEQAAEKTEKSAKKAEKAPKKAAPRKAAPQADRSQVGAELPAKKAAGAVKPAPAKKAAKGNGGDPTPSKAMPAKTTKKQG